MRFLEPLSLTHRTHLDANFVGKLILLFFCRFQPVPFFPPPLSRGRKGKVKSDIHSFRCSSQFLTAPTLPVWNVRFLHFFFSHLEVLKKVFSSLSLSTTGGEIGKPTIAKRSER